MALQRELIPVALELLDIDRVVGREGRTGEVVEEFGYVLIAELLPSGIDLDFIVLAEQIDNFIYLSLDILREFQVCVKLIGLISYKCRICGLQKKL